MFAILLVSLLGEVSGRRLSRLQPLLWTKLGVGNEYGPHPSAGLHKFSPLAPSIGGTGSAAAPSQFAITSAIHAVMQQMDDAAARTSPAVDAAAIEEEDEEKMVEEERLSRVKELCKARWELRECGRLFHGVAEGFPGLTVDRYGEFCLVQSWRGIELPSQEELEGLPGKVVFTPRGSNRHWSGPDVQGEFVELGIRYKFQSPPPGSDPWLFLDLRAARAWLLEFAPKTGDVLNTFAYTCGAGLAAAKTGARVLNLDHSLTYLDIGRANAEINALHMDFLKEDFLCAIRQFAGLPVRNKRGMRRYRPRKFDLIILDPPTKTKGPFGAVDIENDYQSLLKPCLLALSPGGSILATHHSSGTSWSNWSTILHRCAEKTGRPIQKLERIHVADDFPSFDGEPPLKIAVLQIE